MSMLTLYVLEINAEERENLVSWLQSHVAEDIPDIEYAPSLDIRPIAIDELKFAKTPQLAILGPSLLEQDLTWISKISKVIPGVPLIGVTNSSVESLSHIEQMARLGITDTVSISSKPQELLKKLVLINSQDNESRRSNLIIVDSGKGGVGVTTIAGALAELSATSGKRTVLIDFDMETQDLTRFLQVRPFVNENLQLILEEGKPISGECIDHCLSRVFEDEDNFYHMPPPPEFDAIYMSDTKVIRRLLSVFEALDDKFDVIVVDAGSLRGSVRDTLYRIADNITFVLNRDPAALYPSVDRLRKLQDSLSVHTKLHVIDNGANGGLPRSVLLREFSRAAKLEDEHWTAKGIPHCLAGGKWPGSGHSFASMVKASGREALMQLGSKMNLVEYSSALLPTLTSIYGALSSKVYLKLSDYSSREGSVARIGKQPPQSALESSADKTELLESAQDPNIKLLPDLMEFISSDEESEKAQKEKIVKEKIDSEEKVEKKSAKQISEHLPDKDFELISKATIQ